MNSGNENDMIYKVKLLGCAAVLVFAVLFEQTSSAANSVDNSDFKCSFPAKLSLGEFEKVLLGELCWHQNPTGVESYRLAAAIILSV